MIDSEGLLRETINYLSDRAMLLCERAMLLCDQAMSFPQGANRLRRKAEHPRDADDHYGRRTTCIRREDNLQ